MSNLESWLLDILACPRCHAPVRAVEAGAGLACDACRVVYPVEDGIPQMLPEAARPAGGNGETPAQ